MNTLTHALAMCIQVLDHGTPNPTYREHWSDYLNYLEDNFLPSGSGFDAGTRLDRVKSLPDKIVLGTSFHHMDQHGGYCGWTEHDVVITPSFIGAQIKVTGRDKRQIKDYISDTMHEVLAQSVPTLGEWISKIRK